MSFIQKNTDDNVSLAHVKTENVKKVTTCLMAKEFRNRSKRRRNPQAMNGAAKGQGGSHWNSAIMRNGKFLNPSWEFIGKNCFPETSLLRLMRASSGTVSLKQTGKNEEKLLSVSISSELCRMLRGSDESALYIPEWYIPSASCGCGFYTRPPLWKNDCQHRTRWKLSALLKSLFRKLCHLSMISVEMKAFN